MSTICPDCGESYKEIGTHWRHKGYPDIDHHKESLLGMALGDGSFGGYTGESRISIVLTNKEFLDWYRDELGWLGTDVRVHRTKEELSKVGYGSDNPDDYKKQYILRTRSHSDITEWREKFSDEDRRKIPQDLNLTWEKLKYWYISDGYLEFQEKGVRPRCVIGATSYMNQKEKIVEMFDCLSLSASVSSNKIRLGVNETEHFMKNTEPLPGFEHKWHES